MVATDRLPTCRGSQFSLAALLEFVSVCSVLAALSSLTGVAASVFLMAMALALSIRRGAAALAMLMLASLAADRPFEAGALNSNVGSQIIVLLSALALCLWRGRSVQPARSHPARYA